MNAYLTRPRWIILQLVERCNLRCKMCYQWGESGSYHEKEQLKILEFEVIEKIVAEIAPYKPTFALFGGEPFLHPRIFDIIRLIKDNGCFMYCNTNGTLLEALAERLLDNPVDRCWISMDGPEEVNDRQRGAGVYRKVMTGTRKLTELKRKRNLSLPELGVAYTVTPVNWMYVREFFFEHIDIDEFSGITIEMQNYLLKEDHLEYVHVLNEELGVRTAAPVSMGIVQDTKIFEGIDIPALVDQLIEVRELCKSKGIKCNISPRTLLPENYENYFSGNWDELREKKSGCAFPFVQAEITARGDVVTCHSFYDFTLGNVYEKSLIDIWNGEVAENFRKHIRKKLLPICTSCCSYYYDTNTAY